MSNRQGRIVIEFDRKTPPTAEQRFALIAALEFLLGGRAELTMDSSTSQDGTPFGYRMNALRIEEGLEPESEMAEWRRVALSKWRHFKEMHDAYEIGKGYGNSKVALDVHVYGLAKMVPYLLGMPEEALMDAPVARAEREKRFRQETLGRWTDESLQAHKPKPGDPHHHEERMPAYPTAGLDFTDTGYLPTGPAPDAFEDKEERGPVGGHEPGPQCAPDCGV
jgi:hypothetical protein